MCINYNEILIILLIFRIYLFTETSLYVPDLVFINQFENNLSKMQMEEFNYNNNNN